MSRFTSALLFSLLLHGILGAPFFVKASLYLENVSIKKPIHLENPSKLFSLIPAPPDLKEKEPDRPTFIRSDKNSRAANPMTKPELPKDGPYQKDGISIHPSLERTMIQVPKSQKMRASKPLKHSSQKSKTQSKKFTARKMLNKETSEIKNFKQPITKRAEREKPVPPQQSSPSRKLSAPSLPSPSARIKDTIATPGAKNIITSADILDEYSYNMKSDTVAKYFSAELKKISMLWNLEIFSSQEFASGILPDVRKTIAAFKIMPSGLIEDLQILEHDGEELYSRYPIAAIEKAAPFKPLPPDVISHLRTDGLWVKIEFNYSKSRKR